MKKTTLVFGAALALAAFWPGFARAAAPESNALPEPRPPVVSPDMDTVTGGSSGSLRTDVFIRLDPWFGVIVPPHTSLELGANFRLWVYAEGEAPLQIRWYFNGVYLPEHDDQTEWWITGFRAADAGDYWVVVEDAKGNRITELIHLSLKVAAPPPEAEPSGATPSPSGRPGGGTASPTPGVTTPEVSAPPSLPPGPGADNADGGTPGAAGENDPDSGVPKTGDDSAPLWFFLSLMLMSAGGFAACLRAYLSYGKETVPQGG